MPSIEEIEQATEEATYRAIGRFIAKFGGLEFTLRFHLAEEIKLDLNYATVVVTHDFALLCTAVSKVFSKTLKTEEERRRLKTLISKCRALNDIRVKVAHGQWFAFHDGGMVAHVSRRTLAIEDTKDMAKLLEKATNEIRDVFNELQLLLSKFREELKGMPADPQLLMSKGLEELRAMVALEELKAMDVEFPE
jgi:hypothetical protein